MPRQDTTHKLFAAMFNDNPNERAVACDKFVLACRGRGLHPSEIALVFGNNLLERQHRTIEDLTARNEALEQEVSFLRQRAAKRDQRSFRESLAAPRPWKAFQDLVKQKLYQGSKLPRGWRSHVAKLLGRPTTDIDVWENGAEVPEGVLTQLGAASPLPASAPKRRPRLASGRHKKRPQKTGSTSESTQASERQDVFV